MKIQELITDLKKVAKHYPDIEVWARDHTGTPDTVWDIAYRTDTEDEGLMIET